MSGFTSRRRVLLASAILALLPLGAAASKGQPTVVGTWRGAPPSIAVGTDIDLVLHLAATQDAVNLSAEILPSDGIEVVSAGTTWSGSLLNGRGLDLPVTVRIVKDGDWTIGARIINYGAEGTQISGAVLNVVASNGSATLGSDAHDGMKLASLSTVEDLHAMGVAMPDAGSPSRTVAGPAIASTVSGTIRWSAPEGGPHPVRRALVQITNAGGTLLANASTNDAGAYTAAINADSVKVTVFTQDLDNTKVAIFPLGQPAQRYVLESALTPITAAATTIDITSAATVRGTPGSPSTDSLSARAFAVYDAMLTYWFHASAIIGTNHQAARANFPESTAPTAVCGTSCYDSSTQQMHILRDDAFDWDVLGHEFFHFTTGRSALRVIDTNPGGDHSGGTAIGQNDGTGHIRTRDEGMRLAWGEGVATAMSLLIQKSPPAAFPFPALLNVSDSKYSDSEDAQFTDDPESPPSNDGFGAENSVIGLLWDLSDTAQDADGGVTDTMAGVDSRLLWSAINAIVPCNPCDRVDKFWVGITNLFGVTSPTAFDIAKLFVLNKMAPKTTAPANGASVPGTAAPSFQWERNGDPAAGHRNNHFFLAFSRDNFQGHRVIIPVPTLDATSYTPTDAEWAAVQAGASGGEVYKWFLAADRPDGTSVPAGWFWYSNVNTIAPRSIEATITWSPLGADVDFHLANPGGTDIAYYNRTTSWGFLDRDCITTCTQEIISVTSLPFAGPYRLFVHYYSDHGHGAAAVHAVVKSGSQVLLDQSFVLSGTGATHTLISFALDGTDVTATSVAGDSVLAPTALLPKKRP